MARWNSCNILQTGRDLRNLWQFTASGSKFNLQREVATLPTESLPARIISKDWQTLFQPKLNVAWLPADKVFLRVVQIPKSDAAETQSMLELQLEKLSPLPVAQVVWGFELLQPTATPDGDGEAKLFQACEDRPDVPWSFVRDSGPDLLWIAVQSLSVDRRSLPAL